MILVADAQILKLAEVLVVLRSEARNADTLYLKQKPLQNRFRVSKSPKNEPSWHLPVQS